MKDFIRDISRPLGEVVSNRLDEAVRKGTHVIRPARKEMFGRKSATTSKRPPAPHSNH